ncbi:UDP-N-acetylglucosamine 2-epimerase, partial [Duncaniella muris]
AYAAARPGRVRVVPSLGKLRYLSALRCVSAVAGNSSSGIVEVPSMHIPTVDIGMRQRGRLCGKSVIHCGDSMQEIADALAYALSDEGRRLAREAENPYYRPDTLDVIVKAIAETPLQTLQTKKFYDR